MIIIIIIYPQEMTFTLIIENTLRGCAERNAPICDQSVPCTYHRYQGGGASEEERARAGPGKDRITRVHKMLTRHFNME